VGQFIGILFTTTLAFKQTPPFHVEAKT